MPSGDRPRSYADGTQKGDHPEHVQREQLPALPSADRRMRLQIHYPKEVGRNAPKQDHTAGDAGYKGIIAEQ